MAKQTKKKENLEATAPEEVNIPLPNHAPSKEAYGYNSITGEYTGPCIAWLSPLEAHLEEPVYNLPADATFVAPPEQKEGKIRKFDGQKWSYSDVEVSE